MLAVICFVLLSEANCRSDDTVILVSFDGFRWDYLYQGFTPALEKIASRGVRVKQLKNVFPTKTFPNHYSLVTGLFPESHGIVANSMYDPKLEEHFSISDPIQSINPKWWNEAEPIWVTLRKRGMVTAALNFPGSDVEIRGVRPNYYNKYNMSIPFQSRVDTAISWLTAEEYDRPSFIALYFEEPDATGHNFGPDGRETMHAVQRVDKIAKYLMEQLHKANLADSVNVLFTSDHGMLGQSKHREIYLDEYVKPSLYQLIDYSPLAAILPSENMEREVYQSLHNAHPNLKVMHRETVPARLHYRHNRRIQPILALADPGWAIYRNPEEAGKYRKSSHGAHGYDNDTPEMHPYFVATGPAFRRKFVMPRMSSLDVYSLMFHLLDEEPLQSNGTMRVAKNLLRTYSTPSATEKTVSESPGKGILPGRVSQAAGAFFLAAGGIALLAGMLVMSQSK